MIREPQDLADELAAEQAYADMLAHPETVVDALDLFGTIPTCSTESCTSPADGMDGRCWPCTTAETLRRDAQLRARYPSIGRRTKGLRSRGYNGS